MGTMITKEWARTHLKGVEGDILPSFSADFSGLDADGIRHDVRLAQRHGFFAVFCGGPIITKAEYKQLITTVCDEARGKMLVSVVASEPTVEGNLDVLQHAEQAGCSHAMVILRQGADSEKELVANYRRIIEGTNLGIILYAYASPAFKHLHRTGLPLGVYDELANLPNVIGVKLTQSMSAATAMECCEVLSPRLIIDTADLDMMMVLARSYPVQWTGQWLVEAIQSPQRPYVVDLVNQLASRNISAASDLFWKIQPAYRAFADLQRPFLLRGSHPWTHMKYYQWCVGGNGGLLRADEHEKTPMVRNDRIAIHRNFEMIGIDASRDDEELFVVGRSNYAKNIRKTDLPELPAYHEGGTE